MASRENKINKPEKYLKNELRKGQLSCNLKLLLNIIYNSYFLFIIVIYYYWYL